MNTKSALSKLTNVNNGFFRALRYTLPPSIMTFGPVVFPADVQRHNGAENTMFSEVFYTIHPEMTLLNNKDDTGK